MTFPKVTLPQIVSTITLIGILIGWYTTARQSAKEKEQQTIYQHDREKSFDSLRTAFTVFTHDFQDLQKSRTAINKQRDQDKKEDDDRTNNIIVEVKILQTRFEDYIKYRK